MSVLPRITLQGILTFISVKFTLEFNKRTTNMLQNTINTPSIYLYDLF